MSTKLNAIVLETYDRPKPAALRAGSVIIEVAGQPLKKPLRVSKVIIEELQTLPNKIILAK